MKSARIVVSAATTKATRLEIRRAGADRRAPPTTRRCTNVAEAAAAEADIIADLRGSASYKRELLRVYAARAVRAAIAGAP